MDLTPDCQIFIQWKSSYYKKSWSSVRQTKFESGNFSCLSDKTINFTLKKENKEKKEVIQVLYKERDMIVIVWYNDVGLESLKPTTWNLKI